MEKKKEIPEGTFVIPKELFLKCIKEAVTSLKQEVADARKKYGKSYNKNNDYEECLRHFNMKDADKVLEEYELIFNKKSSQPSVVRRVIAQVGDIARRHAAAEYMAKEGLVIKEGKIMKREDLN